MQRTGEGSQLETKLLEFCIENGGGGVTCFRVLKKVNSRGGEAEHHPGTSSEDSKRTESRNRNPKKGQKHRSSTRL